MSDLVSGAFDMIESEAFVAQLLRGVRQGFYFGIETRVPYAVTGLLRPMLFGKPSRPIGEQLKFYSEQVFQHGWILARIIVIFKATERLLARLASGKDKPDEWHTFLAGGVAGYFVMCHDTGDASLKKQLNMAIGIRTLFAIASYAVRKDIVPGIAHTKDGYDRGLKLFYTVLWAVVMWHWRHHSNVKGEMIVSQVQQMDFLYNGGDRPGKEKWLDGKFLYWAIGMLLYQRLTK
jgi:hypothetical protein